MQADIMDDPDLRELAAQQRRARLNKLGTVVAVVAVAAVMVIPSGGSVADALEADGHSDVVVERKGVFDFSFSSKQKGATCHGSVTKLPGTTKSSQMCIRAQ